VPGRNVMKTVVEGLMNSEKLVIFDAPVGVVSKEKFRSILVMYLISESSDITEVALVAFIMFPLIPNQI
jgi:hypothetical protein